MADFEFLQNPINRKWIILAPRRAKRPDVAKGSEPVCPFCLGREGWEKTLYAVPDNWGEAGWQIRVIPNKFPFAPIHEIIIHSPDHHKNFDELPLSQVELIIQTYKQRYNTHAKSGLVYIFHNRGENAGESLPHPHTQLAVIPQKIKMDIPQLRSADPSEVPHRLVQDEAGQEVQETKYFSIFCPKTSQWPDEVWIAPKKRGRAFGEIEEKEISDFSYILSRLIQILDLRHGHEFPYNFYIYPGGDWYLRLIPRIKVLGGFEIGTGVFVNTQDPSETINFIKEHFENPNEEKIKIEQQAKYEKRI